MLEEQYAHKLKEEHDSLNNEILRTNKAYEEAIAQKDRAVREELHNANLNMQQQKAVSSAELQDVVAASEVKSARQDSERQSQVIKLAEQHMQHLGDNAQAQGFIS